MSIKSIFNLSIQYLYLKMKKIDPNFSIYLLDKLVRTKLNIPKNCKNKY